MRSPKRAGRRASVPLSLRFPPDLRARVKRYAHSRGLEEATAIRVLCAERLRELELTEDLVAADRWQFEQAMKSWERLDDGRLDRVSPDEIRGIFNSARERDFPKRALK